MTDEITVDSEILISSKRASILSGYEQDYIGQLCRGGNIKARRVGGLWYVSADSLMKYKERSAEYKPEPPVRNGEMNTPDSLVSFEGKGHISTSRAAKITGYSPDYVGQMARGGVIPSRQVGNRWYVEHAGILKHKESKDALLGAVQVESVGLKTRETPAEGHDKAFSPSLYQYTKDNRELTPSTGESADRLQVPMPTPSAFVARPADHEPVGSSTDADAGPIGHDVKAAYDDISRQEEDIPEEKYVIPIRVYHGEGEKFTKSSTYSMPVMVEPRRAMLPMVLTASLFTIVIVLSFGFISLKKSSVYTSNSAKDLIVTSQSAGAAIPFITKVGDILEPFLSPELVYIRSK